MQKAGDVSGSIGRRLIVAAGFTAIAVTVACGGAKATPIRAQSPAQNKAPNSPAYEYDLVSIKPIDPNFDFRDSMVKYTSDGLTVRGISIWWLIRNAYETQRLQVSGPPDWFDSDRYIVEARWDNSTADELQKLNPNQQRLAREHMLQTILTDRFKLTFHRETHQLSAYFLVIAKDGPKLQDAKPEDVGQKDLLDRDGRRLNDIVLINTWNGTASAQSASMSTLARVLSLEFNRLVIDATGLTGTYDFNLKFPREEPPMQAPSAGAANDQTPTVWIPGGVTLFKALQDHLGLKLESRKGPVEMMVIDHVEKPSPN